MKDDPLTSIPRSRFLGLLDPVVMIFFASVAAGLALIWPIAVALFKSEPIMQWHSICLGLGITVLAGCAWFVVQENKD